MDKDVAGIVILALQIALTAIMWRRGKNGKDENGGNLWYGSSGPHSTQYADQMISRRESEHGMRGLAQAFISATYFLEKNDYEAARRAITDWAGVREAKFKY